jgi:hypothetical protein
VDARDACFESTPLAFATVGSGERPNPDGNWLATVQILLEAGASKADVWLSGDKAPSEEVANVLRAYGAVPAEPPSALTELPTSLGPGAACPQDGALAELAEHLKEAYEQSRLELFASLLHPLARWGDGPLACTGRDEIVARYKAVTERGMRGRGRRRRGSLRRAHRVHSLHRPRQRRPRARSRTDPPAPRGYRWVHHCDPGLLDPR